MAIICFRTDPRASPARSSFPLSTMPPAWKRSVSSIRMGRRNTDILPFPKRALSLFGHTRVAEWHNQRAKLAAYAIRSSSCRAVRLRQFRRFEPNLSRFQRLAAWSADAAMPNEDLLPTGLRSMDQDAPTDRVNDVRGKSMESMVMPCGSLSHPPSWLA